MQCGGKGRGQGDASEAKECRKLPADLQSPERVREADSVSQPSGQALPTPLCQTSSLWTWETGNFCCLSPPVHDTLLQQL